jgi:hypothetical protein
MVPWDAFGPARKGYIVVVCAKLDPATGSSVHRPDGPHALIAGLCLFLFDRQAG